MCKGTVLLQCVSSYLLQEKQNLYTVFALTHLPDPRNKENWIRTSENYERICLNK